MASGSSGIVHCDFGPQPGQKARSSRNFPNWAPPKGATLTWTVTMPSDWPFPSCQPTFNVTHDKREHDKTWYKGVKNGSSFLVDHGDGESGAHDIYVITTNPFFTSGRVVDTYEVECTW